MANNQNQTVVVSSTDTDTTYSELTRGQAASNTSTVTGLASGRRLWDAVKAFEDPTPNLANRPAPTQVEVFNQLETILSASGATGIVANNQNQTILISSTDTNTDTTYSELNTSHVVSNTDSTAGLASGRRLWDAVRAFESPTPVLANRPAPTQTEVFNQLESILSAGGAADIVANNTNQTIVISSTDTNTDTDTTYSELTQAQAASNTSTVTGLASGRRLWDAVKAFEDPTPNLANRPAPTQVEVFNQLESILSADGATGIVANNTNQTIVISSTDTDTDTTYNELTRAQAASNTSTVTGLASGRRLWDAVKAFEDPTPNLADRPAPSQTEVFNQLESILSASGATGIVANNQNQTILISSTDTNTDTVGVIVEDEGTALTTRATTLDFIGGGVAVTGTGNTKVINIPGGGGGMAISGELPQSITVTRTAPGTDTLAVGESRELNVSAIGVGTFATVDTDEALVGSLIITSPGTYRLYGIFGVSGNNRTAAGLTVAGTNVTVIGNSNDYLRDADTTLDPPHYVDFFVADENTSVTVSIINRQISIGDIGIESVTIQRTGSFYLLPIGGIRGDVGPPSAALTRTQATTGNNVVEGTVSGQLLSQAVAAFESPTPNLANRPGPTQTEVFNQLETILSASGATGVVANNQNQTILISSTDTDTDTTYSELTGAQAASNTSTVTGLASGRRLWDAVRAFESPTPVLANRPAPTQTEVFNQLETILSASGATGIVANNQNQTILISSTDTNTDTDTTYNELTRTQAASNTSTVTGLASGRRLWDAVKAFEDPTPNLADRPAPTQTEVFNQLELILSASGATGVVANNQNQNHHRLEYGYGYHVLRVGVIRCYLQYRLDRRTRVRS